MSELLKKNNKWNWTNECQQAFDYINKAWFKTIANDL